MKIFIAKKLRIFVRPPSVRNILKIKSISEMFRLKIPTKNKSK